MFDHMGFGVSDIDESRKFFLQALAPLGVGLAMEGPNSVGLGRQGKPSMWLYATSAVTPPLHIAIAANTRADVDAFYQAAMAAGGKITARRGYARTTTLTTTLHSFLAPMATTWKRCAISQRIDWRWRARRGSRRGSQTAIRRPASDPRIHDPARSGHRSAQDGP